MKNRKRIVVAFLLVAVMLLGIGYAALTVPLTITGNATFKADQAQNEFTGDIYFSETALTSNTAANPAGTDTATRTSEKAFDIAIASLSLKDETASFTFTINNSSLEHDATLAISSFKIMGVEMTHDGNGLYTGDEWLKAKVEWPDTTTLEKGTLSGEDVTPGTATLKVTFTLLKSPTETVVRSINIGINATTTE